MKRYLALTAVLVLVVLICFAPGRSPAQEEEEIEHSWGTVNSVSSNQIIVSEYDYESEGAKITYTIDPAVELINVNSLKNIAVGDSVDIEYVVKGSKKVAKLISVEKTSEAAQQKEDTPSEIYGEEMEYPSPEAGY